MLQKIMLFINVLTAIYERIKYENNNVHYFNINLKKSCPRVWGRRLPIKKLWGKTVSLTVVASDSSMINNLHLFRGLPC